MAQYVGEDVEIIGEQVTVDISNKYWRKTLKEMESEGKTYLYTVRDVETGTTLKVGQTSDLKGRLGDYVTGNNTSQKFEAVVDVVEVKLPEGTTAEAAEKEVRDQLEKDLLNEAEPGTEAKDVLPWDNTNERLGRSGPGTPGEDSYNLREKKNLMWDGDNLVPYDPSKPVMGGRVTGPTPEFIAALEKNGGNAAATAREVGVPERTAQGWAKLLRGP
jgi:hypothetical protein